MTVKELIKRLSEFDGEKEVHRCATEDPFLNGYITYPIETVMEDKYAVYLNKLPFKEMQDNLND